MTDSPKPSPVVIGKDGYVYADGVKLGKFVSERKTVQFLDRDRRRCMLKGREMVEVRLSDLADLQKQK